MLVYSNGNLETLGYTNFDFQWDIDSSKITYEENLEDPFPECVFKKHVNCMSLKRVLGLL